MAVKTHCFSFRVFTHFCVYYAFFLHCTFFFGTLYPFLILYPVSFSCHSKQDWEQELYHITHIFFFSEKAMAPHSSTLAWKIPWTEEPGGLQSMGSRRVGHDRATSLLLFTFIHWRRKWQPTPVFLPGESQGRGGAWWAAIYGVTQSRTQLKWLSSSTHFFIV